jgi:hypothetical protein
VAQSTSITMSATTGLPYDFVTMAMVGDTIDGDASNSSLSALLVDGEKAILATNGDSGCTLFTSTRVIIGQKAGILTKRLAVSALRRNSILAYSIDPSDVVTLDLLGSFGKATLLFDGSFNPMLLSSWLGETLSSTSIQKDL